MNNVLMGNNKVPAGLYALNIPLIIIKGKNNCVPQIHLSLNILRSSTVYLVVSVLYKFTIDR